MLENGEPLKPVYSLINENEHEYEKSILLRIKGRQPNLVLQYNGISERYSSDMHVSVVINVKDFTYELPQLTNSHLIIAYANKPTHYVERISQSSYGYYQGNLYFTDIHENYGTCVHIDMEKVLNMKYQEYLMLMVVFLHLKMLKKLKSFFQMN